MNLDFTDEQRALRDMVREFFEKESPAAVVRAAEPLGFDASLWRKVADLGVPAIAVAEEAGGAGPVWSSSRSPRSWRGGFWHQCR